MHIVNESGTKTLCGEEISSQDVKIEYNGVVTRKHEELLQNPNTCNKCRRILIQIMNGE